MIHVVLLLYIVSNYIEPLAADLTFIDAARHIQVAKYDMELSLPLESDGEADARGVVVQY